MKKNLKNWLIYISIYVFSLTTIGETYAQFTYNSRAPRKNIETAYTDAERTLLYNYMNEWITAPMVNEHNNWFNSGIHNTNNFLPWHRVHLQMWETFVKTKPQGYKFIPFPYFDANGSIPRPFNGLDVNGNTIRSVDDDFWVDGNGNATTYAISTINPTYSYVSFQTNLNSCGSNWKDVGNFTNGLESSYHNGGHGAIGGIMGSGLSPMSYVFWMWHAWVDEQWYFYEKQCQGTFTVSDLTDHIITLPAGTTTWSTNQLVKGQVQVPKGCTLIINNGAIISFSDSKYNAMKTNITVFPGGRLIIDNATLTGIDILGSENGGTGEAVGVKYYTSWEGIIVKGISNSSRVTDHGWVTLKNGATIENASKGILSQTGGRIITYGSANVKNTFRNNRIDIEFQGYAHTNLSNIAYCTFTLTEELRDAVWKSTPIAGSVREHHINENHCTDSHIKLTDTKGVNINNCSFVDTYIHPDHNDCIGIRSYSSRYRINNCTFQDLGTGIHATNRSCGPRGIVSVYNSTFTDNLEGIVLNGSDYSDISGNTFNIPASNTFTGSTTVPTGVFAKGSAAFNIYNNTFVTSGGGTSTINAGVVVENSYNNYSSRIKSNTFTNIYRGTQTQASNTQLQISCNSYNNFTYGIASTSGTLNNQGACTYYSAAGNTWNSCPTSESQFFKDASVPSFDYRTHSDRPLTCYSPGINIISPPCSKEAQLPCNPPPCAPPCAIVIINDINIINRGLVDLIDRGATEMLLSMLDNPLISSDSLRIELIKTSPLSDRVLTQAIKTITLSNHDLVEVIIENSTLTQPVMNELQSIRWFLFTPLEQQEIINAQLVPSERAGIEKAIAHNVGRQQDHLQDVIRNYVVNDELDSAITFINIVLPTITETFVNSHIAVPYYPCDMIALVAMKGNVAGAISELSSMPELTANDVANKDVLTLDLNILYSGRELDELTGAEEQELRAIAATNTKGGEHALSILSQVFNEPTSRLVEPINQGSSAKMANTTTEENSPFSENSTSHNKLLRNYPNPFSSTTTIEFFISEKNQSAFISIYNVLGKEVAKFDLKGRTGYSSVVFDSKNLNNGMYFYNLVIDGKLSDKQKMVLIK